TGRAHQNRAQVGGVRQMNFLVVGGSGFIGSAVVKYIRSKSHIASVIDLKGDGRLPHDIRHRKLMVNADLSSTDTAMIFAALTSQMAFEHNPEESFSTNVEGLFNVLEACRRSNVKKVLFASSSAVYGNSRKRMSEEDPYEPFNMYAASKVIGEYLVNAYIRKGYFDGTIIRYFNVYGIGENEKGDYRSIISIFLDSIRTSGEVLVYGDGCLPAGETIFCNPNPKQIETLVPNDLVLTTHGFQPVQESFRRHYSGKMFKIKAHGLQPFRVTEKHPVLITRLLTECRASLYHRCKPRCWCIATHQRGFKGKVRKSQVHKIETSTEWIPASGIRVGDFLTVPRLVGGNQKILDLSSFVTSNISRLAERKSVLIDEDWAYIIGLFIADGWTSKSTRHKKIHIALNDGEDALVLSKIKAIMQKKGFKTFSRIRTGEVELSFTYTWFARWLDANVGIRAKKKRIPSICFDLPYAETKALIEGLFDGDGYEAHYARCYTSSSPVLLRQLQVLLTKIGRFGTIAKEVITKDGRKWGMINWGEEVRTKHWLDESSIHTPVQSITVEDFEGEVYNVETVAHNYCTPATIHNSQRRDFINVKDAARITFELVMNHTGTFNVGTGRSVSWNAILNYLKSQGLQFKQRNIENPIRDYQHFTESNTDKLASIGLKSEISIEDGIRELL
ncbi:NAD-dependent epimerase/dehydratase family protein, partial [Candidatus Woesearchaeota archaeon]|nr:NAD-dependent epimerase/dehydratase family protein [Candidatus Woesearchaeota archaeon]